MTTPETLAPAIQPETNVQALRPEAKAPEHTEIAGANDLAERPEAKAPEHMETAVAADGTRPPGKPPESFVPQMPAPPKIPQPFQAITANDDFIQDNDGTLKAAEQHLASYIGDKISAGLAKGLVLNLVEEPSETMAGLKLSFQGPNLTGNKGILLGRQLIAALQAHPQFAPLFENETTTPRFAKPLEADKADMVDVHIAGLDFDQYTQLLRGLAQQPALSAPPIQEQMKVKDTTETEAKMIAEAANANISLPAETIGRVAEAPKLAVGQN